MALMGVASRKEKWAEERRLKPKKRAVVMVMPLRETPGMMARAWERPIKRASPSFKLESGRSCRARRSAKMRRRPTDPSRMAMR